MELLSEHSKKNLCEIIDIKTIDIELVQRTAEQYKNRLQQVSPEQAEFSETIAQLLSATLIEQKPVVIPARCGFGKSTIIYSYLSNMIRLGRINRKDSNNKGVIVVTERLDDLKEIAEKLEEEFGSFFPEYPTKTLKKIHKAEREMKKVEELNKSKGEKENDDLISMEVIYSKYGKEVAAIAASTKQNRIKPWMYVMEGWGENVCERKQKGIYTSRQCSMCNIYHCKVKRQKEEQAYSPILGISMERLNMYLLSEEITEFDSWCAPDKRQASQKRTILIIDEQPKVYKNFTLTETDLVKFKNIIMKTPEVFSEHGEPKYPSYNQVSTIDSIQKLQTELFHKKPSRLKLDIHDKMDTDFIPSNKEDFYIDKEYRDKLRSDIVNWLKYFHSKGKEIAEAILCLVLNGGIVFSSGISTLRTYYKAQYDNENPFPINQLKTYIFDGTAHISPEYDNNYNIVKITDGKRYKNVTFHIIPEDFTKSSIMNNKDKVLPLIFWINEYCDEETFLLTYRNLLDWLQKEIENEDIVYSVKKAFNKTVRSYFGNVKGKNDFSNCRSMIHLGWNRWPNEEYIASNYARTDGIELLENKKEDGSKETYKRFWENSKRIREKTVYKESSELLEYADSKVISDFEQNIMRCKLRDFNYDGKINIYLFLPDESSLKDEASITHQCRFREEIVNFLNIRYPGCEICESICEACKGYIRYKEEYEENVIKNKKNKKPAAQRLLSWLEKWNGDPVFVTNIQRELTIKPSYWLKVIRKPEITRYFKSRNIINIKRSKFNQLEIKSIDNVKQGS